MTMYGHRDADQSSSPSPRYHRREAVLSRVDAILMDATHKLRERAEPCFRASPPSSLHALHAPTMWARGSPPGPLRFGQ